MNEELKKLPQEVQDKLTAYLERIKEIKWFKPSEKIDSKDVEQKVKFALDCFGIKAELEWKKLETVKDWDAARGASLGAARGAAWGAAWDAARDAALDAARGAAWGAAWGSAWGAARGAAWGASWDAALGACDIVAFDLQTYKEKYPNGAFINLIPIWELGLYPIGVVNGKFVIYIPQIYIN